MSALLLFSCSLEMDAAFPGGPPAGADSGLCGVGLIDAAIGTSRLTEAMKPEMILFVGTCGVFRNSGVQPGQIVVASEVSIVSGDIVEGTMRVPTLQPVRLASDELLRRIALDAGSRTQTGVDVVEARVCCTLGITESDELAEMLSAGRAFEAENLEAFSVLRAAGETPTAILLGVTNYVGSSGGADWRANYSRMLPEVGRLAEAMLSSEKVR